MCPCGGPPSEPGFGGGGSGEQHRDVNGDIALAALQYWWATGDAKWLASAGYALISGVAEFWQSRATKCAPLGNASRAGTQCIDDVMRPDEFHGHVNNSAYTTSIAAITLKGAADAARSLGKTPPPQWEATAETLYVPFDAARRYHPEYDGYDASIKVKQADAVLLGYPLNVSMPHDVKTNDLAVYESTTDPNGPAMTWAMYSMEALDRATPPAPRRSSSAGTPTCTATSRCGARRPAAGARASSRAREAFCSPWCPVTWVPATHPSRAPARRRAC